MKTPSSNYMLLLIMLIWFFCSCSLCSSVRILGDQRWSTSIDDVLQCNNIVQRRFVLSDSRGFVCNNMAINPATACYPEGGEQYSYRGCNALSQCCNSYEYCVSCCLNPMRIALEVAMKIQNLPSMQLQVHENAYVSGEHHCFSAKFTPTGEAVEASAEDEVANVYVIVGGQGFP